MIALDGPQEPYPIKLPYEVTVTVRPLTCTSRATAEAAAKQRIQSLEGQLRERRESGLGLGDLPDLGDPAEREAFCKGLLVHELAARHIVSWAGVLDAGGESEAPVTRDAVAALMDIYPMGERFFHEFALRQVMMNNAKNVSALSAAGTSGGAEGRNTAGDAPRTAPPAPAAAGA